MSSISYRSHEIDETVVTERVEEPAVSTQREHRGVAENTTCNTLTAR